MASKRKKAAENGDMQAVFGRGMKQKDLERGGGRGDQVMIKRGDTVPIQFLHSPDEFLTFREHQWQEDRKWFFVPCTGDECVLCDDESDDRAKVRYQFAAQVFNVKEKKCQVLKGGKDLGGRVFYRFERKPSMFTKRVLEITKFATQPVSFEVSPGDDKPVDPDKLKPIDLEDWLQAQLKEYYGDNIPQASSLDDEDDDEPTPKEDDDDDDDDEKPASKKSSNGKPLTKCPECGKKLDEDGDCLNPKCDWLGDEEPPEPEPEEPKKKARARR